MSNAAMASADGPESSLPIDDGLRASLALLRRAHDYNCDAQADPWDFALEIHQLYDAGMTISDLRWLVVKGFVEHGSETSTYGDAHRSFTQSAGFNFLPTTCVVLTKKGAAFACRLAQASADTSAATEPLKGVERVTFPLQLPKTNGDAAQASLKPHWDARRRELSLGGRLLKRFLVPARNQALILDAFEEEGWPEGIDDPLPGHFGIDPKSRLNDVIYRLNRTLRKRSLRFHTNGNGNGVHWSLCDAEPTSRRLRAASKALEAV